MFNKYVIVVEKAHFWQRRKVFDTKRNYEESVTALEKLRNDFPHQNIWLGVLRPGNHIYEVTS